MSARKRRPTYEEDGHGFTFPDFETSRTKRDVTAPEIDMCSLPIEGISPAFNPDRALLRRVFFLEDRNRYVSVAFYLCKAMRLSWNLEETESLLLD